MSQPAGSHGESAHATHHRHGGVAVTLAAAAVLASGLGARAAISLGTAGDELQSSVRTDVKRAAGLVEDARFVYEDEATMAYRFARAQALAQELRRVAARQTGVVRAETLVEAGAQSRLAAVFRKASAIAKNPRYARGDGSFDVGRRLGDARRKDPNAVALDPEEKERAGARAAWHGNLDAVTTIGPALAFLCAALAQAF